MKRESLRALWPAAALAGLLFSSLVHAAHTPVSPGYRGEPDVAERDGILDHYFGMDNLTRIDDDLDRYWRNNGDIQIQTLGKWAGFSQSFGYIDIDDQFTSLFNVNNTRSRPYGQFHAGESGAVFRFGLDPSGASLWSSDPTNNADLLDHMVTWRIEARGLGHHPAAFVVAWEDLHGGGDHDFNDLVLLVKGDVGLQAAVVPVPGALLLFGSGMFGLVAVARRQSP